MKHITLTMTFNISEEDFKDKEFQYFKNAILNGVLQREIASENKFRMSQVKISLIVK